MIENFRIANPCQRCSVRGICEATEDDCFLLRNYMSLARRENINRTSNIDKSYEDNVNKLMNKLPDKAYSVPFIVNVEQTMSSSRPGLDTIVKWSDNTATRYTIMSGDYKEAPKFGLAMCIMEKLYGDKMCGDLFNNLYEEMKNNGKMQA